MLYLETLGNNRYYFSYLDRMVRELCIEMKIYVYFGGRKEGRRGRERNLYNIVELIYIIEDGCKGLILLYFLVLIYWTENFVVAV